MILLAITLRQTSLTYLLAVVLLGAVLSVVAVMFGLIFRSAKWWMIATALISATVGAGILAGILDRVGSH
jgi:RsiW-degrading membrane proteinase PrsW (M82 family)